MTRPDPRPRKRYKATPKEWEQIRSKLLLRACQVCLLRKADSLHHVVRKSQGGDDWPDNMLAVCGTGTTGCHGLLEARDRAALAKARLAILSSPAIRAYILNRKGEAWLDRAYPPYLEKAA